MSDWLHDLPVIWMALVVFAATYLTAGLIHAAVNLVIFGLYLAFTAAQVSGDIALREPPHFCDCDGAVCHRRDRLRVADRQPQPAFHWRDLGRARPTAAGPARVVISLR